MRIGEQRVPQDTQQRTVEYGYPEDTRFENFAFIEREIRHLFIRKVYSTLMIQLAVTVGITLFFRLYEPARIFMFTYTYIIWISIGVGMALMIVLVCCESVRRTSPLNIILLMLLTVCQSIMVAAVTCHYRTNIVLIAFGITCVVCLALTLFAFQTRFDFTGYGAYLLVVLVIFMVIGIVAIFIHDRILHLVYASLGTLVMSCYLVYDTQLMLGGKHKYALAPNEYILGALHLYIDIVLIFLYILQLLGLVSE